ncbi:DNA-binding domain-containing protein [Qingshengfaniella alkalisoli]|uniref:DUF2063 domain-containing protein n=1 Tax=Qingshengfaniella alkalisoli TaxID=2599296 RepID=A0A5B8J2S5_9RHOB|nr:DNA-binding domain-containing protein [Qingshengfaniella alkalisoli]QDY68560.1 DUF2063 domain-containing protein [Qingshengfaniella alkalisoli]
MDRREEFASALLAPEQVAPEGLVDFDGFPAPKRFAIYRNNVAVSLTEALESGFPVTRKLVGEQFFRAMAGAYLRSHPPSSPLMFLYGDSLSEFLEEFPPAHALPYPPDMARLEYTRRVAYHAADSAPIDASMLSELSPDELMASRVRFAPSCHILKSRYPVLSIWHMNTSTAPIKSGTQPENILISRPRFDPELDMLTDAEATLAGALKRGLTLGAAIEGRSPDTLGSLLTKLLAGGCIHRLEQGSCAQ